MNLQTPRADTPPEQFAARSNAPEGVWVMDASGVIVYANESLSAMLDKPEHAIQGKPVVEFMDSLSADDFSTKFLSGTSTYGRQECVFLRQGKPPLWLEVNVNPWINRSESKQSALCTAVDVTSRRQAQAVLDNIQRRQKAILDNIPDIAWLKDADGRFIAVNEAFAATCGMEVDEVAGKTDFYVWDLDLARLYYAGDMEVLRTGEPRSNEELIVDKQGRFKWVETVRTPIFDEANAVIGVAGIARDITARKQAVDDLLYSRQELEQRVKERTTALEETNQALLREIEDRRKTQERLRQAKQRADSATRAKSLFLANMSHEIRTPLNAVLGMTELALQANPSSEVAKYLRAVKSAGGSLLTVINDILDLSKIEAKKLVLESVDFNVRQLLHDTVQLYSAEPNKKGVELHLDVSPDVPEHLKGDPMRLRQVLGNLLVNAVKFTQQGTINVRARLYDSPQGKHRVLFSVQDTGIGIAPEKQQAIFQPFTQADESMTRLYGGAGLGLTICCHLVSLMGGFITLESEPDSGSTFLFSGLFYPGQKTQEPEEHKQNLTASVRLLHILLVEDNSLNQELAQLLLDGQGHTTELAVNGKEALELLEQKPYDLVLMDIQMPEMDGLTATQLLRSGKAGETNRNTPVIAMTAHALKGDRERFLAAGMNDYIAKPIDVGLLASAIARAASPDGHPQNTAAKPGASSQSEEDNAPSAASCGVLDTENTLKLLRGNQKLLQHLQAIFLRDAPDELGKLAQALDAEDLAAAKAVAHNLKGTSATVGAMRFSEYAAEVDNACQIGDAAIAKETLLLLQQAAKSTFTALRELAQ